MSDYLDPNNEELLKDFFAEAEQQVEQLESNILVIENDPSNHEAIDEIFRAAHTLKGGSATVEMMELSHFTHSVEDVLDEIRSDRVGVTEDVVDVLLTSIDIIKAMLEARKSGSVYSESTDDVLAKLKGFIPAKGGSPAPKAAPAAVKAAAAPARTASAAPSAPAAAGPVLPYPEMSEDDYDELVGVLTAGQKLWCVGVRFDETNPMNSVGGIQVFAALKSMGNVLKTVPDFDALYEDQFYEYVFYYLGTDQSGDAIEDASFLSDVTLVTDARQISRDNFKALGASSSAPSAAANTSAAPAPAAAPAAPAPAATANEELLNEILKDNMSHRGEASASSAPAAPVAAASAPAPAAESSTPAKKAEAPKQTAPAQHAQQGSILRVDSKRIDNLMNLVSEAVIIKASFNQLAVQTSNGLAELQQVQAMFKEQFHGLMDKIPEYIAEAQQGVPVNDIKQKLTEEYGRLGNMFDDFESAQKVMVGKFRSYTQNLGTISGDLQEGVMKIRMVPINQIFSRFPRVVRDLQRDLNKKINLVIEGEDTELDKSVVEELLDPIMHCVRNSVDHGIEMPDVRKAAGKPETGTVLLRASNEGNMIVIEIKDDGAGINVDKVRKKAIDRGLIHPDKVISDQDAYNLIMQPGFSTADKISNISGRGVGLDVVRTMITNLKGSISVSSVLGQGTTFTIKLPLTLAIIQGLLVKVGKEVYSIPIANVIESQCIPLDEINRIDNHEIMNLRNEVISVLRLSNLFNIKNSVQSDECYIVIVGTQEKKIGVMVDSLIGEEDVVIKPLQDKFTDSPGIAGASILGDGSVSLIVDVSCLLDLGVRQELLSQSDERMA